MKKKKKKKKKATNKYYIVLNLDACEISSVGGGGILAIVADRQRGSDVDNSIFALTWTTFEIVSNLILWHNSSKYRYLLSSLPYSFVYLFDFLLYFHDAH